MNPRTETYTPAQTIYRQAETIRRQATVIDTLKADRIVHLAIGAVLGGGFVVLAYWQADPVIRWINDALTAAGWTS